GRPGVVRPLARKLFTRPPGGGPAAALVESEREAFMLVQVVRGERAKRHAPRQQKPRGSQRRQCLNQPRTHSHSDAAPTLGWRNKRVTRPLFPAPARR